MKKNRIALIFLFGAVFPTLVQTAFAVGRQRYVLDTAVDGSFPIVQDGAAAGIYVDPSDWAGVGRAAGDLQADIARVTGCKPDLVADPGKMDGYAIIIGTVGRSRLIRDLVQRGKVDVSSISGKWESFFLEVVNDPVPNVRRALVIAGSDKRGTIYGIYDLSEQMGVSPLYWWADVPARHRDALHVKPGRYAQGPPSVKYRGIFLNDEAPDLSNWVREKFGTVPVSDNPPVPEGVSNYNSEFYARIFETILRMKGNYLWPAMWNNAFNEDDPKNPELADTYGVVMGTSHQEPMLRAQKEWDRRYRDTLGSWNYYKNPDVLQNFWREGIRRNRNYESIVTIGLRGANDTPMIPGGTVEQSIALLEEIVRVQREMIAEEIDPDVTQVPQLWCLYKEVQQYYEAGLRVPDDVTLLWSDDNWGDIRRLPTAQERDRAGGAGIYYHFDYVGGPRNYKWINTISIPKVWEQMHLAKESGADRIWIVNVGHFKHLLFPMEFFLNMAWDSDRWTNGNIGQYTRLWAAREFGEEYAEDIADIVEKYTRYNARRKPELLSPDTYALNDYLEADRVVADFQDIVSRAEAIDRKLPEQSRDAFYELVLFPARACALVNELYVTAGRNRLYAKQKRAATNDLADRVERLFQADAQLMDFYNNTFAGGKWKHFMDQVHIGYTIWQDPPQNVMPAVERIELPDGASMGVAVEGSSTVGPGAPGNPALPEFDPFNRQRHYIDVFNKGKETFAYTVQTDAPWIVPDSTHGVIDRENRIWVSVDWGRVPEGAQSGTITVSRNGVENVGVEVPLWNAAGVTPGTLEGFVENNGFVSIEAEHFTRNVPAARVRWEKIEGYGRTLSAMTVMPANAPSSLSPPEASPCLEYRMYLAGPDKVSVLSYVAPTLNFNPDRGLRFAVSFDNEAPQIMNIVPKGYDARNGNREWENSVKNSIRTVRSEHEVSGAGYHTLKIWMVDPAVVLEKIVVDLGGLHPSYLGPPESCFRIGSGSARD
jgi:hypothetical protein